MSTDTPRFNPEPTSFTPGGDADLTADPSTGRGPDGAALGTDTPAGDVDATASGSSDADSGSGGSGGGSGVGSPEKDPSDWVTGDEPMTGPQQSYLSTLAREAGEEVPEGLNKAQASEMIDRLQDRTGRGN